MKVVHLLPALEQGGVETVVAALNRVLVRAGETSVVISRGGRMVDQILRDGGSHIALDLKAKNPLTYLWRVLKLHAALTREKPDLVCVHSRVPAWLYVGVRTLDRLLSRGKNARVSPPWITYAHGANSVSAYSAVMTKGDLIVSPSRFLIEYLKKNYGTPEEKFRLIPNPVDLDRFNPAALDSAFVAEKRREWGIQSGDHVLMAVGRITKVKGLDSLIRSFAQERRENPHLKLVIVGGADRHHLQYLDGLKALAASLVAEAGAIIFAGSQTMIPECLSLADEVVSANTTKPESFGLSIVEAYAMNKPVRAKRFGGAAEVMEAVAAAQKPTLREAVLSLYATELFAARTLATYRTLIQSSPR